jgi:hypothetical protein
MAHKVVNPILFGVKDGAGLGNNADEMTVALKTLYRSQIKPTREIFIDGLENILSYGGAEVELYFKDFEELVVKEQPVAPVVVPVEPVVAPAALSKEEFNEYMADVELKKWRSSPDSSNVKKIMYQDETKEMVIQFNSGDIYTYYDVDFALFQEIFNGAGICRTEGSNRWGSWFIGKTPSVGAAVNQLLDGTRYSRGGSLK